ncbi:hypothetical protein BGZ96_011556 [Linnemannia gamsii]|uniref:SCP domain-containing protein n=1 Tax=Linnemannia gamsii TaxID=64522 RepID=A0ABQ7JSC8_9FUNG|nr:hypothetical protein BGZ96_011556 [Linnemannia gamsii]
MKLTTILIASVVYLTSQSSMVAAAPYSYDQTPMKITDVYSDSVLVAHNRPRVQYGAKPLTWSPELYTSTLQYAKLCKFASSDSRGKYGENLYATTTRVANVAQAVNSWMAQAPNYNYNNPVFSSNTGKCSQKDYKHVGEHNRGFTQVVWKSSTQVACAQAACAAGTIYSQASTITICRYAPPGNMQGQFAKNVGRPAA